MDLIRRKASLNARAQGGLTPVLAAAMTGNLWCLQTLHSILPSAVTQVLDDGRGALHLAAESGHEALVALLLSLGISPHLTTDSGLSALHLAAASGHDASVKALLLRGAAVDARDHSGATVALRTFAACQWAIAETLVSSIVFAYCSTMNFFFFSIPLLTYTRTRSSHLSSSGLAIKQKT